jgi:uncharacterized protein
MKNIAFNPLTYPLYLMAKPIGAVCNLNCSYCYYLEKELLYENRKSYQMSDQLLERFVKEYIEAQPTPNVSFTWHGGESLLRDVEFYKKALRYQKMYAKGRQVENCIQTNGVLLNDDWCEFFAENNFLVGVSIDGPEHCHDIYRKNKGGKGTFREVMRGIELLKKHGVEFNTMSVINNYNARYPLEVYCFLKEIGSKYLQFSPVVERIAIGEKFSLQTPESERQNVKIAEWSVAPEQFGDFYIKIFDEWVKKDVGETFVQLFDATLAGFVGVEPGVCYFTKRCGHAAVIEFNGDVYSCDHFVFPEHRLGNIYQTPFLTMMLSEQQVAFGEKKRMLPTQCLECKFLSVCNGECPKNRFVSTKEGEPNVNYLCEGYKSFFSHVEPYMRFMAKELVANRPPANVMKWDYKDFSE